MLAITFYYHFFPFFFYSIGRIVDGQEGKELNSEIQHLLSSFFCSTFFFFSLLTNTRRCIHIVISKTAWESVLDELFLFNHFALGGINPTRQIWYTLNSLPYVINLDKNGLVSLGLQTKTQTKTKTIFGTNSHKRKTGQDFGTRRVFFRQGQI